MNYATDNNNLYKLQDERKHFLFLEISILIQYYEFFVDNFLWLVNDFINSLSQKIFRKSNDINMSEQY